MSTEIIVAIIGSSALATVLGKLIDAWQGRKNKVTGLEKGVQMILLGEIKRAGGFYLQEGYISAEDLQAFEEMYKCYHTPKKEGGLGGNGFAEAVYNKVKALPIR